MTKPHDTAPTGARHSVAVLLEPGPGVFELAIATEIFGLPRPELDLPWYELKVCTTGVEPVPNVGGLRLTSPYGLEDVARADTVIVPSCTDPYDAPRPEVLDALRRAHANGARIVSICSGAFLLAAAGLLDGRRATTHWRYAHLLRERFPRVVVDPDVLYVDDGDVLTSAGSAAGIDLCLHLVRLDHGSAVANVVARRLVMPPHRDGGQAQFIDLPVAAHPEDDPIARVMAWALGRLDQPLSVDSMAREAFMSVRTFTRRFGRATGMSPGRWLLEQRIRASLPLLETSGHSIDHVATLVGFSSAGTFRHHFAGIMRTSPSAYRRSFQQRAA